MNKSKFLTVIFSFLPGVGHFYLGWMERGLQFLITFFLCIYLLDLTGLSLFGLLLPIIWFYSLFDALQIYDHKSETPANVILRGWFFEKQRWVGFGLIAVGLLAVFYRVAVPWIYYYFPNFSLRDFSTILVAVLFVVGGIRLAFGKELTPDEQAEKKVVLTGQESGEEH